jgi:hypothetical protein
MTARHIKAIDLQSFFYHFGYLDNPNCRRSHASGQRRLAAGPERIRTANGSGCTRPHTTSDTWRWRLYFFLFNVWRRGCLKIFFRLIFFSSWCEWLGESPRTGSTGYGCMPLMHASAQRHVCDVSVRLRGSSASEPYFCICSHATISDPKAFGTAHVDRLVHV